MKKALAILLTLLMLPLTGCSGGRDHLSASDPVTLSL